MRKVVHFEIPGTTWRGRRILARFSAGSSDDADAGGRVHLRGDHADRRDDPVARRARAINGGMMQRVAHTPSPVLTIDVDGSTRP